MIKNKYVKKAEEELEYLSGDAAENMDILLISKITGLTKEEIEKLK